MKIVLGHLWIDFRGVFSTTMEPKIPLSIVYLGRRGGGAKIASLISKELANSKIFSITSICIRRDNELRSEYDQSKLTILFDNLLSIRTILKTTRYAITPKRLLADLRIKPTDHCLVPMMSPLGLLIEGILKLQGVKVIRLIHDFEKHPGDKWPPTFLIKSIIKRSDFIITLSHEIALKISSLNSNIRTSVYLHPVFDFDAPIAFRTQEKRYILFIGRIRRYKGVLNLLSAFSQLFGNDIDLVIAGEGKIRLKKQPNVTLINRWLKESEITELIQNAEVIVFPYLEASQSGFLPYCVNKSKKIVITPLPGLLEQVLHYDNVFVTQGFEARDLVDSLNVAIKVEPIGPRGGEVVVKNIETCLLESGFFPVK